MLGFRALGLLALVAVGSDAVAQDTSGRDAPGAARARFDEAPCPFWSAAESERYGVRCGTLEVPSNESGRRRYRLQVVVLQHRAERRAGDAIVVIPGGPGSSIVGEAARLARHPLQDTLRQNRDIVLLDPRGTGYSEPGELCPSLRNPATRVAILQLSFEQRTAHVRDALRTCRDSLEAHGVDPGDFNSVALARDLEGMRQALGYERLNLIGLSWGTRVSLEMMRRYPDAVRSAMLYGPFAPDASTAGGLLSRTGPALDRLFRACDAAPACRGAHPDLAHEFSELLANLDDAPIDIGTAFGPFRIDGSVAEALISYALYDSGFLPYVPLAIRSLEERNASFVEALLPSVIGDQSSGGFYYAAHCFELAPAPSPDSLQRLRERFPWGDRSDRFAPDPRAVCDAFVPPGTDSTMIQLVHSAIPTVILVGEFDPTTPLESARRVSATLTRSQLLVLRGKGHDVNVPNPCTVRIRMEFLEDPLQPLDTSCVASLPAIEFATDVHALAGVSRVLTRLVVRPQPIWLAGTTLLLLALLTGSVGVPVMFLRETRRGRTTGASLAAIALWAGVTTALVFVLGLAAAVTSAPDAYMPLFGVPGAWQWVAMLPPVAAALTMAGCIGLAVGRIRGWWSTPAASLLTLSAVAGVAFVWLAIRVGFI